MATQHARPATKNSTDATSEGGELKNGTADDSSDDSSANNMVNKGRSTTPGPNSNNVDAFQDGGQPTANSSRPPNMDYHYQQQNFNNNNQDDFNNSEYRGNYEHDQKLYPQYSNQQQMRPPFSPRAQPRYPARFVSGPSVSQQTGPTPTLNQLLQAPNSMQRYHNNYEYPNQQKGDQQHYPNNQWGRGYPQQQQMYRNQGDVKQQRSYQMSSPGGQPYPQQPPYPPYPQGPRHNYPPQQQQGGQHPSGTQQQHGPSGYDGQRPQMANYSPANVPPPQPTPTPPSQQQQSQQQPQSQQQQQDGCDEGEGVPSSTAAPLRTTPPGVSPHRPPSGSPSPSMSPALGQPMPPRPSSTQSENSGQVPPATPQGYTPQPMAPPGMYGVNKMHQNMMPPSSHYPPQAGGYHRPPGSLSMHNYGSQNSSYPPSGPPYPPGGGQQRMPSTTAGGYPSSNAGAPYSQPPYPATGGGASYGGMPPPNHYPKASMPPPPAAAAGAQAAAQAAVIAAAASSGGTVRQSPMYLRQHLQQKMYNSYGPDMPPPPNASEGAASTIGPPTATTSSPSAVTASSPSEMMQSPRNSMGPPPLMDEGSQASNASASSSLPEDNNRVETPKPAMSKQQPMMSHPLPSPGAASMSSFHDDLESVSSPSWPRTPASPVINNQPYDHHPIKRPDGLLKLYDMSDELERRLFLDKLIVYQEERGTPLSQCPTISKQPLDLYRLYMAAKERGGFVEVMKGKMWKEIAGLVGIGASSSAAYTLRKQYIKHLLPFECKFDRGGIDPVPLISSLESSSRKKAKNQGGPMMDGYPGPYPGGGGGGGYPHPGMEYPGGHHPPYPTDSGPPMHPHPNHSSEGAMDPFSDDIQQPYPPQTQRHNSSSEAGGGYAYPPTAGPPYGGGATSTSFGGGYGGAQEPPYSGEQYPPDYGGRDPYAPPPGGYPPNRTVGPASQYPPYQTPCGDQERFVEPQPANPNPMLRPSTPTSSVIGPPPQQESSLFPRYPSQPMGARESQPMGAYQGGRPTIGPTPSPSQYSTNSQTSSSPGQYTQTDAYNRGGVEFQPQMSRLQSTLIQRLLPKNQSPQQNYPPSQPPPQQGQGSYGGGMPPPNKVAPPGTIPPAMYQRGDMYQKRHPDYPPKDPYHYPLQTPSQAPYTDRNQYQYRPTHGMPPQSAGPPPSPQQGWPRDGRSYGGQYPQQRDNWGENPSHPPWAPRYGGPPQPEPPYMGGPKMMSRGFPHNKMTPHGGGSATTAPPQYTTSSQQNQRHREVHFPPDCVESTLPLLLGKRRRRLVSRDLPPVDPWRLMMSLKSGLLGEGTWALDVLNILLHDDATVLYFGLAHMPGLLEVVVEHYRRCLWLVFGMKREAEVGYCEDATTEDKTTNCTDGTTEDKWWELDSDRRPKNDATTAPAVPAQNGDRTQLLLDTTNYTHRTRCRKMVKMEEETEVPLFLLERKWDVFEGHASDGGHWARGGGEWTGHIQTHFEDDERRVRFCRVMEDMSKSTSDDSKVEDSASTDEKGSNPKTSSPDDKDSKELCSEKNSSAEIVNSDPKGVSDNGERTCETDSAIEGDFPKMRESCKRRAEEDLEEESYTRDEPSLCTVTDAQDSLSRRCIAVSSILRNLSFVPGNDAEMSKHSGFLLVLGRLLLLHHTHSPRRPPQRHYDQREDEVAGEPPSTAAIASDSCSSLSGEGEWWWETLHVVRENTLVTLANVCGQLDLAPFPEEISFPLLDGLMHWVTCPSSSARDPLPTLPPHSVLSPQRLSLEALSKLSVLESNVDLMMALPPWERTSRLLSLLARWLARNEDQVLREFSVVLLSNLAQADSAVARAIALQPPCVPLLITFVEQAEQSALAVANAQGIGALRDNPELMGTTLDMVRRAAGTLRCLARVPANRVLFMRHQQRLLALVMSQILDQGVASIVADVLYECSSGDSDESH